jgi:hypothetical protein
MAEAFDFPAKSSQVDRHSDAAQVACERRGFKSFNTIDFGSSRPAKGVRNSTMASGPTLPPQAYTRETLTAAFNWLQTQPESIRKAATTPDTLVSLYTRAKRFAASSLESDAPVSSQAFMSDLKNLAEGLKQFDEPKASMREPAKETHREATKDYYSAPARESMDGKRFHANSPQMAAAETHQGMSPALPSHPSSAFHNSSSQSIQTSGISPFSQSNPTSAPMSASVGVYGATSANQPSHFVNSAPVSTQQPSTANPSTQTILPSAGTGQITESGAGPMNGNSIAPPSNASGPVHMHIARAGSNQVASTSVLSGMLNERSWAMIQEVKNNLNLSSDAEAVNMMVALAYKNLKTLL